MAPLSHHHFLRPGGKAAGDPRFSDFTFDHRLSGTVVGCRRDNKELFMVRVTNNRVTEKVIRPADPRYLDYPPLPYEAAIDRDRARVQRRRRPRAEQAAPVVDLDSRRA